MTTVSLIDGGHHEIYHREKKMNSFLSLVSPIGEVRGSKTVLGANELKDVKGLWFFGPSRDLKPDEAAAIESFMGRGGALFLCGSEFPPIFESLMKKFGVTVSDPLISPTYITYVDPYHVSVQHGIVNRAIAQYSENLNATFAYPNGHSLEIKAPSVPILASGQSSYPLNRPIISHAKIGDRDGSLTVIGSAHMFCDEWIKLESNAKLLGFLVDLAITGRAELNQIEAEHPEVTERCYTPDIASMSERLRSCIQESEKMRSNFDENFDHGLFTMDLSSISETHKLAQTLGIKNEPLETVVPQFDTALPALTPAVFPPQMRDPPAPVLELFDLDDAFASSKTRLAQLAQRANPKNAEQFTVQAAKILGILPKLPQEKQTGRGVLEFMFTQVIRWKRQSQD
jgi:intraflagellar transport protein 52